MATRIELKVLNELLDLYEKSKTFLGENKNHQTFKITVSKLFPKYDDDSEFALYKDINQNLDTIRGKGFITFNPERSGKINTVSLEENSINQIYEYINRVPKADVNNQLMRLWNNFKDLPEEIYSSLLAYLKEQQVRVSANKSVQFFEGNLTDYEDLLNAVKSVLSNQNEIFIRELSVKLFNNSKRLEAIENTVRSLLYKYGEYDDKETVFEEHNIIKTPTYVMVKGKGILHCGETVDLSKLKGDIGFSTQTLKDLKSVELNGANVITIENLTNFHKYQSDNELVIYLGGFHNSIKRDFIKLVEKCNSEAVFKHFGDIDAGGFYILEHLKTKTGINFIPYHMDINTLENNKEHWIKLTENDKSKLCSINEKTSCYEETIDFMLKNNCKLEQESEIK
ncbi:Wadjet anti-phage system protein JetD domain-containing protein [Treponema sp.]|uniref:Wadjet anti-phage system protein JetD domain-containing protein n=1 Tax=Treponema sp. TaxID=166 RepID=UPI00388D6956